MKGEKVVEQLERLSNVRGHLREVIDGGDLSERYRNYLKHVDNIMEETIKKVKPWLEARLALRKIENYLSQGDLGNKKEIREEMELRVREKDER